MVFQTVTKSKHIYLSRIQEMEKESDDNHNMFLCLNIDNSIQDISIIIEENSSNRVGNTK